jgi:hypothetical protein
MGSAALIAALAGVSTHGVVTQPDERSQQRHTPAGRLRYMHQAVSALRAVAALVAEHRTLPAETVWRVLSFSARITPILTYPSVT